MFESADNFEDIFRNLPYWFLLALPILVICSNPTIASEFNVHRMSQFDVNGVNYGSRSSAISFEAKSLYSWNTGRQCVVAKLEDMNIEQFREIRQKAGGLVLLLPRDVSTLGAEEKYALNEIELEMLAQSCSIPVYFSPYNAELEKVISDITRTTSGNGISNSQRGSAISELFNAVSANGYQIVVSGSSNAPNKNSKIAIIQGEIAPAKYIKQADMDSNLPMIVVSAHLNTFGIFNEYPLNADAAVLMTMVEMFSKLHSSLNTAPKYRLMFLLSESGVLLNFQGIKKWLDENMQLQDDLVSITGNLIAARRKVGIPVENLEFVLCLDTIVRPLDGVENENALYMHVSKPPKEGTPMNKFYRHLKSVGGNYYNISIDGVHKRINLAESQLAWEHERFSIRRLPAFTLSALKTPKDVTRTTIFKDSERRILKQTEQRATIIAEALARYVFNIEDDEDGDIFAGAMAIKEKLVKSYINVKSALHNNDLRNAFEKHLKNVKLIYDKPDSREPDFMFYDGQEAQLNVYNVKPAVFDLILTLLISVYLVSVYFTIQYFPHFYDAICKLSKAHATNANGNANYNSSDRFKAKSN